MRSLENDFKDTNEGESIPETLGLKIILHYAEDVDSVQIGKHIKLVGEGVIIAHRLLKNKIKSDEYLLLSEYLLKKYDLNELETRLFWDSVKNGQDFFDHIGLTKYA